MFQQPTTTSLSTTFSKHTLAEELADELSHYFRFEAALVSEDEPVEKTCAGNELSLEEVLLNLLLWWKVSASFILSVLRFSILQLDYDQIHASEFAVIAQMAQDYLAIPATSVSVKHLFSKS